MYVYYIGNAYALADTTMIAVLEKTKTPHNPDQSSVIDTADSLSLSAPKSHHNAKEKTPKYRQETTPLCDVCMSGT